MHVHVSAYFGVGASALCQCMSETIFVKANFFEIVKYKITGVNLSIFYGAI